MGRREGPRAHGVAISSRPGGGRADCGALATCRCARWHGGYRSAENAPALRGSKTQAKGARSVRRHPVRQAHGPKGHANSQKGGGSGLSPGTSVRMTAWRSAMTARPPCLQRPSWGRRPLQSPLLDPVGRLAGASYAKAPSQVCEGWLEGHPGSGNASSCRPEGTTQAPWNVAWVMGRPRCPSSRHVNRPRGRALGRPISGNQEGRLWPYESDARGSMLSR